MAIGDLSAHYRAQTNLYNAQADAVRRESNTGAPDNSTVYGARVTPPKPRNPIDLGGTDSPAFGNSGVIATTGPRAVNNVAVPAAQSASLPQLFGNAGGFPTYTPGAINAPPVNPAQPLSFDASGAPVRPQGAYWLSATGPNSFTDGFSTFTHRPVGGLPQAPSAFDQGGIDPLTGLPGVPYGPGVGSQGYAEGTKDVKPSAKGKDTTGRKDPPPGPTDTVPSMLTPGEAVLNTGAVQHMGTALIEHMNKIGLMKMGQNPDQKPGQKEIKQAVKDKPTKGSDNSVKPAGYADGTSDAEAIGRAQAANGGNMVGLGGGIFDLFNGQSNGANPGVIPSGQNGFAQPRVNDSGTNLGVGFQPVQAPGGFQTMVPVQHFEMGGLVPGFAAGIQTVMPSVEMREGAGGMPDIKGYAKGTSKVKKGAGKPTSTMPQVPSAPATPQAPAAPQQAQPAKGSVKDGPVQMDPTLEKLLNTVQQGQ